MLASVERDCVRVCVCVYMCVCVCARVTTRVHVTLEFRIALYMYYVQVNFLLASELL